MPKQVFYLSFKLIVWLVTACLLFAPGVSFGQKTGKPLIDSLLTRLPLEKTDTGRCNIYSELSYNYLHRDPVLAYDYADKLQNLAQKIKWKKGLALTNVAFGNIYNSRREYATALGYFNKYLQLSTEIHYASGVAGAYNNIALNYRNQDKIDLDIEFSKKAVSAHILIPDHVDAALRNMVAVANGYIKKNQANIAIDYFNQLLKNVPAGNLYNAYITDIIADIYLFTKKTADALKSYEAAEKMIKPFNNFNASGFILEQFGDYYMAVKDTSKGMQFYQKAVDIYTLNHSIKEADELSHIADVMDPRTHQTEVLNYYQRAIDIYKNTQDDKEGDRYVSIGNVFYIDQSKKDRALSYYQKAIDIYKTNQNKVKIAQTVKGVGDFYYAARHDYKEAFKNYSLSADMYGKMSLYEDQALRLSDIAIAYLKLRDYTHALSSMEKELQVGKKLKDNRLINNVYSSMAYVYIVTHNYEAALKYEQELEKAEVLTASFYGSENALAVTYYHMGNWSRSLEAAQKALQQGTLMNRPDLQAAGLTNMANAYYQLKDYDKAIDFAQRGLKMDSYNAGTAKPNHILGLAVRDAPDGILVKYGINPAQRYDKALDYLKLGYDRLRQDANFYLDDKADYWNELSITYEKQKNFDKAYDAYKKYVAYRDSVAAESDQVNFQQKETQFNYARHEDSVKYQQQLTGEKLKQQTLLVTQQKQRLTINQQQLALANRQKDLQQADLKANQNKLKATQKEQEATQATFELQKTELNAKRTQSRYFIGGLIVLLLLSFFIARNYYNQRKANRIIVSANKQTAIQKAAAESRLFELRATQDQLVQSEKLASLGELTAGIAHEIQNPLNFVNNFSDVSIELVDEMEEELAKGDTAEAIAIAQDIKQNLEKIMHHGKRADAIVKNMLEHSRNNSGEKQLADINVLADEYLRLSYHGLRAKDKMFNAHMVTDFDAAIPKMEVIGQDIGRVLLNLYNNAFYAVQQRKKAEGDSYKPEVKVSTKLNGKFVEVRVTDNGTGIPDAVKGKILQPFFTTKPTGEGTGLGLSLSYDIVAKGHGGTMEIDSKEGEFTEFKISLPV